MLISAELQNLWAHKGHYQGECMSHPDSALMYVHIPKNASSWTKPNLQDHGWQFYNYKTDNLNKHALVVLRDPVERWLSGIGEYLTLYHPSLYVDGISSTQVVDLIFDRVTFDDHTERQVYFLDGLDTSNCTFFWCDETYRERFSEYMNTAYGPNKYSRYAYQHVSENSPERRYFKQIFAAALNSEPKYLEQVKQHFALDYELIEQIHFYGPR